MTPFVGPSYALANRKASVQRAVNLFLVGMETASKAQFVMYSAPGLESLDAMTAPCRGVCVANGRLFVVGGSSLYEIDSAGVPTELGTLLTGSGPVSMAYGLSQLVIVDGTNGYVLTLATDAFANISDPDWPGANAVGYLDGFFVLTKTGSQQAYVTSIDDATAIDALDFASAESNPDNIVTHVVAHREIVYLGDVTIERWFNAGASDYPFARDTAATAEIGCMASGSAKIIDNSFFWVGRDINGNGFVFRDVNRQPQRISTAAIEEALQGSSDLSQATAYTYQMGGLSFYCLNAPGLSSTWVYEVSTGTWHERCDLDALGQFKALRVTHTAFAHGKQFAFDADGVIYEMRSDLNTFDGDPIKRTRISPNDVTPMRDRAFYSEFAIDCTTGEAPQGVSPQIELSWSDDGGYTWGNPVQRSAGRVGEYQPRVVWHRLGSARDRVWRIDFAENVPFSIISADVR